MVNNTTAKHHGVCPICEGYGGRDAIEDDPCERDNSTCEGSCPKCWCPGCHDGWSGPKEMGSEAFGSWEAYELVQSVGDDQSQLQLDAKRRPGGDSVVTETPEKGANTHD
jgi:hypothetical protein